MNLPGKQKTKNKTKIIIISLFFLSFLFLFFPLFKTLKNYYLIFPCYTKPHHQQPSIFRQHSRKEHNFRNTKLPKQSQTLFWMYWTRCMSKDSIFVGLYCLFVFFVDYVWFFCFLLFPFPFFYLKFYHHCHERKSTQVLSKMTQPIHQKQSE